MVGEHIRVRKGGRWYHAIDCGDETVLHLADEPGESPVRVRRSYRPEFVMGAETVEVVAHRERTFPPNEVIARAYSRIADPVLASMFRDSEAFAKWCSTGRMPASPEATPAPAPAAAKKVPAPAPGARAAKAKAAGSARPRAKPRAAPKKGKARTAKAKRGAPAKRKAASRATARRPARRKR